MSSSEENKNIVADLESQGSDMSGIEYWGLNGDLKANDIYSDGWTRQATQHLYRLRNEYVDTAEVHYRTRDRFTKLRKLLHVPAIVFISLTTFLLAINGNITDPRASLVVHWINLLFSLLASIFQGVITLFGPTERAANHNISGNNYIDLANYISEYLVLHHSKRPDVMVILEAVRLKSKFHNDYAAYVPTDSMVHYTED